MTNHSRLIVFLRSWSLPYLVHSFLSICISMISNHPVILPPPSILFIPQTTPFVPFVQLFLEKEVSKLALQLFIASFQISFQRQLQREFTKNCSMDSRERPIFGQTSRSKRVIFMMNRQSCTIKKPLFLSASLAQWQSVCLVNRRSLVRFQHEAPKLF